MADPRLGNVVLRDSYLAMIRNAEGANLFRNLYATVDSTTEDILHDGERSCALFVSAILYLFYLVETPHTTVSGLERDLAKSGWHTTDTPHEGDILIWEPKLQNGETNAHAGFYLGNDEAISNNWQAGVPAKHHCTYGTNEDGTPVRAITAVYTRDFS